MDAEGRMKDFALGQTSRRFLRYEEVRDYVNAVGMAYLFDQSNVEKALLNFWERGYSEGQASNQPKPSKKKGVIARGKKKTQP